MILRKALWCKSFRGSSCDFRKKWWCKYFFQDGVTLHTFFMSVYNIKLLIEALSACTNSYFFTKFHTVIVFIESKY